MSLLQMRGDGRVNRRKGVNLEFVLVEDYQHPVGNPGSPGYYEVTLKRDAGTPVPCTICGKAHAQIYTAWRKPRGTWGPWVIFHYNGKGHPADLSIPISVHEVPRGSVKVSEEENAKLWHG